jgi:hypothetical protein
MPITPEGAKKEKCMPSKDPAILREKFKRTAFRRKYRVLSHYSNGVPVCSCCGESLIEFLTLDHINGDGAQHRRALGIPGGGYTFYGHIVKENYPPGYRVLCYNCNCSLGFIGYCPHTAPERAAETLDRLGRRTPGKPGWLTRAKDIS